MNGLTAVQDYLVRIMFRLQKRTGPQGFLIWHRRNSFICPSYFHQDIF